MKIIYDEHNRVSEIIFAEGEDQKAFWEFMQNREKEITERSNAYNEACADRENAYKEMCINRDNAYKEMCIAKEKEITARNKDYINSQVGYIGCNGLPSIN